MKDNKWKGPDWKCPHCYTINKDTDGECVMCGYIGGEFKIKDVVFTETK